MKSVLTAPELTITPRGPLSAALLHVLAEERLTPASETVLTQWCDGAPASGDVLSDDDVQLALFVLYALHYGSLGQRGADLEWDVRLIAVRQVLERLHEAELRRLVGELPRPEPRARQVADALFALTSADGGPSLSRFVARRATPEQLRELLVLRSIYTLREADPHSWAIPRLTGQPKAALVEIQADEYGGGRLEGMHARIYAVAMRGAGLSDAYAAYLDLVPAVVLASLNTMSLFGLNRRLRGAIVGHLAAFEMTSTIPNRYYRDGFARAGFGEDVQWYFAEHVEADAVHEQIAAHDLAGALAEQEPDLLPDIMFGAAASLAMDGLVAGHVLPAWQAGRTALRRPLDDAGA